MKKRSVSVDFGKKLWYYGINPKENGKKASHFHYLICFFHKNKSKSKNFFVRSDISLAQIEWKIQ